MRTSPPPPPQEVGVSKAQDKPNEVLRKPSWPTEGQMTLPIPPKKHHQHPHPSPAFLEIHPLTELLLHLLSKTHPPEPSLRRAPEPSGTHRTIRPHLRWWCPPATPRRSAAEPGASEEAGAAVGSGAGGRGGPNLGRRRTEPKGRHLQKWDPTHLYVI